MVSRGFTFIYIDYGNLDRLYLELRYSLSTLLYLKFHAPVDVVVYTDKPARYRDLPVRIVDIASKIVTGQVAQPQQAEIARLRTPARLVELGRGLRLTRPSSGKPPSQ